MTDLGARLLDFASSRVSSDRDFVASASWSRGSPAMTEHDGDEDDRRAVLGRRELLRRRALLVGTASLAAAAADCGSPMVCLSYAAPLCGGNFVRIPTGAMFWQQSELGEVYPLQGPLFARDKPLATNGPIDWRSGRLVLEAPFDLVNELSDVGKAAFRELVPSLAGQEVAISISVLAIPRSEGDGESGTQPPSAAYGAPAEGRARATSLRVFLINHGIEGKVTGQGTCAEGSFVLQLSLTLCAKGDTSGA
jgi:hypothetical protein